MLSTSGDFNPRESKSHQVKSNQVKSHHFKSHRFKSHQVKSLQVKSSQVTSVKSHISSSHIKSSYISSSHIGSNHSKSNHIKSQNTTICYLTLFKNVEVISRRKTFELISALLFSYAHVFLVLCYVKRYNFMSRTACLISSSRAAWTNYETQSINFTTVLKDMRLCLYTHFYSNGL